MAGDGLSASIPSTTAARMRARGWCWAWRPAARCAASPIGSRLPTGRRRIEALGFLSDKAHPQWAGVLSLERQAELIAGATGLSGRNVDYLADLVGHLAQEGVRDRGMARLLEMAEGLERQP